MNKPSLSTREVLAIEVPVNVFIFIESKKMYMYVDEIEHTKDSVIFKSIIFDGKEYSSLDYRKNKNKTIMIVDNYSIEPNEIEDLINNNEQD